MNAFPSSLFSEAVRQRTVELVPLIEITLPADSDGSQLPTAFLSDRQVTVGGNAYQRRITKWSGIQQDIKGATSTASFVFSNVDRVMEQAARDHAFYRAQVVFKVYAPYVIANGGSAADATRVIWSGFIAQAEYDLKEFTTSCKDGFFALTLPIPRRRITRNCDLAFDDGCYCPYSGYGNKKSASGLVTIADMSGVVSETPFDFGPDISGSEGYHSAPGYTSCSKTFSACKLRKMTRFFGGLRYVASWDTGDFSFWTGKPGYSSYSSANDSIFNQALPLVYTASSFTLKPPVFQWRSEKDYLSGEVIASAGPLGTGVIGPYSDQSNGIGDLFLNGVAPTDGQHPSNNKGVARSAGRIGEPLLWDQTGGDLKNTSAPGDPPVHMSGVAGAFVRIKSLGTGINNPQASSSSSTSGTSSPSVRMVITAGKRVWKYTDPTTRTRGPSGAATWIALDMILDALDMAYAISARHQTIADLTELAQHSAYCSSAVSSVVDGSTVPRYFSSGAFKDLRTALDQIDAILTDCASFRFWRNGLFVAHPYCAGQFDTATRPAFEEFVNMVDGSFKVTIPQPKYNELQVNYADRDFDFEKNTATVYSEAHELFSGQGGHRNIQSQSKNLTTTCSTDQSTRLGSIYVKDEIGGTTQLEWQQFRTMEWKAPFFMSEVEIGEITYIGHTLLPGGGQWVRVTAWSLNEDWTITFKGTTFHIGNYDDTVTGVSTVEPAHYTISSLGARLPLPLQPGAEVPAACCAPLVTADGFAINLDYAEGTSGLRVGFDAYLPPNVVGIAPPPDVSVAVATVTPATLGLAPGNYIVCLCAYDNTDATNPGISQFSELVPFTVASGSNGTMVLTGFTFGPNTRGYSVFVALEEMANLVQVIDVPNGTLPTSISVNSMPPRTVGPPDIYFDHLHPQGFAVKNGGCWALSASGPVVGSVISLSGAVDFTTDQFVGHWLEFLPGGRGVGSNTGIKMAKVTANDTAGHFTVQDATGFNLVAGDLILCKLRASSSTPNSVTFANITSYYPSGFGGSGALLGDELWITKNGAVEQVWNIVDSTSDRVNIEGEFNPPLTADSQFLVVYSSPIFDLTGNPLRVKNTIPTAGLLPEVASFVPTSLYGYTAIFRLFTESSAKEVDTRLCPFRLLYVSGTLVTGASSPSSSASNVSPVSIAYSKNFQTSNIDLTAVFTPPADGTVHAIQGFLELPDFSNGAPLSETTPNVDAVIVPGVRIDLGIKTNARPDTFGNITVVFQTDKPFIVGSVQYGRLYLDSVNAAGVANILVPANQTGPTPNLAFTVAAAENSGLGQEYAPLIGTYVTDPRGFPLLQCQVETRKTPSGWEYRVSFPWYDPTFGTSPDRVQQFQGVDVDFLQVIDTSILTFLHVPDPLGFGRYEAPTVSAGRSHINAGVQNFIGEYKAVPDPQQLYLVDALSVGPDGVNTFSPLSTPQGYFYTPRLSDLLALGGTGVGQQTAPLGDATNFFASGAYGYDTGTGNYDFNVTPIFTPSTDSTVGFYALVVERPLGSNQFYLTGFPSIGDGKTDDDVWKLTKDIFPSANETWGARLISYDINQKPKYPDVENLNSFRISGGTPDFGTSPSCTFAVFVQAPQGQVDQFAELVLGVTGGVYLPDPTLSADGAATFGFFASWENPYGPKIQGIMPTVVYTGLTEEQQLGQISNDPPTFRSPPYPMGASTSGVLYLCSVDANNRVNPIVYGPGGTPYFFFNIAPTTSGSLKGHRLSPATLGRGVHINTDNKFDAKIADSTLVFRDAGIAANLDNTSLYIKSTGAVGIKSVARQDLVDAVIDSTKLDVGAVNDYNKFAGGLRPSEVVASLPTNFSRYTVGATVILSSDYQIYRSTGSGWTTSVSGSSVSLDTAFVNRLQVVGIVANSVISTWAYLGYLDAGHVNAGQFTGCSLVFNNNGVTTSITNAADGYGGYGIKVASNAGNSTTLITPGLFTMLYGSAIIQLQGYGGIVSTTQFSSGGVALSSCLMGSDGSALIRSGTRTLKLTPTTVEMFDNTNTSVGPRTYISAGAITLTNASGVTRSL